ncbi:MAG: UDP-N-acetylmuramate dehydrogenase [Solirubrobacteraceae bacterium]
MSPLGTAGDGSPAGGDAPAGVRREVALARFTTVRTGGAAELFARPSSAEELVALLRWAERRQLGVGVIGSGSNLLVADEGVTGLVLKLGGALAGIEPDGPRLRCGGGARLPQIAARAAQLGLSGIEFGVSIPGTVGGAVRMNANAYGGELAKVLEWVEVATAAGTGRRDPAQLGFAYRRSSLESRAVVTRVGFLLRIDEPERVKATLADLRAQRKQAQPSGIRTFGSTFKNPENPRAEGRSAGQLLDAAGCGGLRVGGARFSPKHANFVDNDGTATTADVVALMALGRARVAERFGVALEPEVQRLGPVRLPWEQRC